MRLFIELTGTSPLVMHNPQLADPLNSFSKAIAKITAKGSKMTDDDRFEVARLEFAGGLYTGTQGPFQPAPNIIRCMANAAKITRQGRDVERALIPTAVELPLKYKGPRDPVALWENELFRYPTSVKVGRGRVQRMRPRFPDWSLKGEFELLTDALDYEDFASIAEQAGLIEGLGDNRRNGFGRFTTKVTQASARQVKEAA
jgi:hypothetical protein